MDAVNRIFAYLNNNRGKGIRYSGKYGFNLKGFVDSDFAGCEDSRRSTTGWVFTPAGGPCLFFVFHPLSCLRHD